MHLVLARKAGYDLTHFMRWLWGVIMPQEYGEDRLIFRLSSDDAIELDRLGEGFAGLARQFKRHLEQQGLDPEDVPSKLYVTRLRTGSIEFEIAAALTLYAYAETAAGSLVIWHDFYQKVHQILNYLAGYAPRPSWYRRQDATDYDAFLRTIAGKRGAALRMRRAKFHQRSGRRETLAEFDFNEQDLSNAHMKLGTDLIDLEQNGDASPNHRHKTESHVPFIWFRTDRDKGRASGQTSDRGIIAKVSDRPLPVYFASEVENQKDMMVKSKANPFSVVYLIDASVEYDEKDNPRSYTILNIHKIIDGGEEV